MPRTNAGDRLDLQTCVWLDNLMLFLAIIQYCGDYCETLDFDFAIYLGAVELKDDIDRAATCIKLRWARSEKYVLKDHHHGECYSLTCVESIFGIISLVLAKAYELFESMKHRRGQKNSFDEYMPWHNCYYYINHFYNHQEGYAHDLRTHNWSMKNVLGSRRPWQCQAFKVEKH